jgi:DNA-binding GntR family transcriptional regulator
MAERAETVEIKNFLLAGGARGCLVSEHDEVPVSMTSRRPTLAEQAYEELQEQIISGQLPAGRRLLADELAGLLDVSQTPVKEALNRLERDGLIQAESRRGASVRRFSRADMDQIYEARLLLECHAARVGIAERRVTPEFLERLQGLYDTQMIEVARQTNAGLAESIRLDREFHELIVSLAANAVISGWHRIAIRQTQTIRNYSIARYDGRRLKGEHLAIIAALRGQDTEATLAALGFHLKASLEEFLSRPPEDLPTRP